VTGRDLIPADTVAVRSRSSLGSSLDADPVGDYDRPVVSGEVHLDIPVDAFGR
jgi:hypothetical protein